MMKRYFTAILALAMVFSLAACSGSGKSSSEAGSASASSTPGAAAGYPKKAVTMIIPYGAGGTTDLVGRQLAVALKKQLGQTVVVENMSGASGSVGAQACLDADADGYTILLTAESLGTQRVMGISKLSYADFAPILPIANDPKVIVVGSDSPYVTIEDLLADIKAHPGKIQMSYSGPGGTGHIQALIMNKYGYEPALTAYSSGSEGITAVLGKQVAFTNSNFSTVASYIESGDLKLLAAATTSPLIAYPDVPTLASVMEGSESLMNIPYSPLTLLTDKDVPVEIQEALRAATSAAVKDPDFNKFMEDNCIDKLYEKYTTTDEMKAFFTDWESTVSWMLYDAGATVNSPEEFGIAKP